MRDFFDEKYNDVRQKKLFPCQAFRKYEYVHGDSVIFNRIWGHIPRMFHVVRWAWSITVQYLAQLSGGAMSKLRGWGTFVGRCRLLLKAMALGVMNACQRWDMMRGLPLPFWPQPSPFYQPTLYLLLPSSSPALFPTNNFPENAFQHNILFVYVVGRPGYLYRIFKTHNFTKDHLYSHNSDQNHFHGSLNIAEKNYWLRKLRWGHPSK